MGKNTLILVVVSALVLGAGAQASIVIDTVPVGNPGNAADTRYDPTGYGGVDYTYNIGTYEVTNGQYAGFLNAVATVGDPQGLYNTEMGGGWSDIGGIARTGQGTEADPWVYTSRTNRGSRPVNYVSWHDTLRFANWMHNGQPTGAQNATTTEAGAYDMSLRASVVRSPNAIWFLPSEDEWYKAAYYKGGGINAGYWDYPTESNTAPTSEAPPGTDMTNGSANYWGGSFVDPTYFTTAIGAYDAMPSDSAYGTFDQGGNLWEWNESDLYGDGSFRGVRGGVFNFGSFTLHAMTGGHIAVGSEAYDFGFRVAKIPEPTTIAMLACGALALTRRRRSH